MSTYLVAYANGVFEYLESSYTSPLSGKTRPLRVYGMFTLFELTHPMTLIEPFIATPNFVPLTQFALDVKAKTLPLYEKVFDIEYPLPKLDTLVASDFDAGQPSSPFLIPPCSYRIVKGAMENWVTAPAFTVLSSISRFQGPDYGQNERILG
jgi:aminopeptidase N